MDKEIDSLYIDELDTQHKGFFESATDEESSDFYDFEDLSNEIQISRKNDSEYMQELDTQYKRFFESATDEEAMAFGDCENLSDEMRFRIIDMLEELDCIDLLDEFLIKYRGNPLSEEPTYI